ncbi:MAG TPA: hypothetical protein VFX61_05715 [Micromonosporaceae bacterium]|nr:hypothetical protein [Micromonosporaceae bacterium]
MDRWLRGLVIGGAGTFVLLLVLLATALFSGGSPDHNADAPVSTSSSLDASPDPPLLPTAEVSPSPSTEPPPSPAATQRPRQRPADLIAGTQAILTQLVRDDHLDAHAAKDLNKRLREVSKALNKGDTDKASKKLREFAEKADNLRKEGKLTAAGYDALAAALAPLAQTLGQR